MELNSMTTIDEVFGRINENGIVDILYKNSGEIVTQLDTGLLHTYSYNSLLSTQYEHVYGI